MGGIACLALLGPPGCGHQAATDEAAQPAEQVLLVQPSDVVLVQRSAIESGISFSGDLAPEEVTEVIARFEGDLERVLVREGQRVRRGQALARYRPTDITNSFKAAEAEVLAARAAQLAAENSERRAGRLLEAGAASTSDLESASAARTAAEARLRSAEAMLEVARENAGRLDVPAPVGGWVRSVFVHDGDRTAVGDPLVTVVDTDTLELSATVPSEAIGRVRPGTAIRFSTKAIPEETFSGEIDRVSPTTEPGTRQIRIYTRVPNPGGRLVGGLFATGRVVDERHEDALVAPIEVLRKEGAESIVYALSGGRTRRVVVATGLYDQDAGLTELTGPLQAGDSLLAGVVPGLRDSMRVRLLESHAPSSNSFGAPE